MANKNVLQAGITPVIPGDGSYETVAASQTAQVLGRNGAHGDILSGLLIVPETVAAGAVTIIDGATSIIVYVGGAVTPLLELKPIFVPLFAKALTGPWKITTGTNVHVLAFGSFS